MRFGRFTCFWPGKLLDSSKLIQRGVPLLIVCLLCFWNNTHQYFTIRVTGSVKAFLVLHWLLYSRETQVSGNIMFSSATQPPPPPRHNFVVSAITFEGFKLRYSNLKHALLIQISRTRSIIDIVVQSKMAAGSYFVDTNSKQKSWNIDLKWPEMRSKVIFGHPKWPPAMGDKNSINNR